MIKTVKGKRDFIRYYLGKTNPNAKIIFNEEFTAELLTAINSYSFIEEVFLFEKVSSKERKHIKRISKSKNCYFMNKMKDFDVLDLNKPTKELLKIILDFESIKATDSDINYYIKHTSLDDSFYVSAILRDIRLMGEFTIDRIVAMIDKSSNNKLYEVLNNTTDLSVIEEFVNEFEPLAILAMLKRHFRISLKIKILDSKSDRILAKELDMKVGAVRFYKTRKSFRALQEAYSNIINIEKLYKSSQGEGNIEIKDLVFSTLMNFSK